MSSKCVFCKIVTGDENSVIHYEDEEIMIFDDIKPASKFHFLAIPKKHIDNINSLKQGDVPLVEKLVSDSKRLIGEKGGNPDDALLGFHVPPFNSIGHLHLHVISPASEMSFVGRIIFKPNPFWFYTVDQVLHKLSAGGSSSQHNNKL